MYRQFQKDVPLLSSKKGKGLFDAKIISRDLYHKTAASLFRNSLLHPIVSPKDNDEHRPPPRRMMRCLFTDLISPTSAAPPGKPFPSSFCFCYTQNITHCTYCTMYSINLDDEQTYPSIVHLKIFGLLNDNLYPSFLLSDSTCFWKSCHSSSLRG